MAPLAWVSWVPGNPLIFEQWVPELINFQQNKPEMCQKTVFLYFEIKYCYLKYDSADSRLGWIKCKNILTVVVDPVASIEIQVEWFLIFLDHQFHGNFVVKLIIPIVTLEKLSGSLESFQKLSGSLEPPLTRPLPFSTLILQIIVKVSRIY